MSADVSYSPVAVTAAQSKMGLVAWVTDHKLLVAAFGGLMLVALVLRLFTFDRFLPYIDNPDEMVYIHLTQQARNLPNVAYMPDRYAPPTFYGAFNAGVQILVESIPRAWIMFADYVYALRLASVVVGVVTVGVMVSLGWQLGGVAAGWFAGAIWALTPIIVDNNSFALPDPFVYLFLAATFSTALRAWRIASPRWLLVSLVLGILVIYAKFWIVTAVIPFVIVAAILTIRQPRRMLPWLVLYAVVAGGSAAHLMLVVRPLEVPAESFEVDRFRSDAVGLGLSPDRNFNNFWWAVYPIGHVIFYVMLAGGILAYIYSYRRQNRRIWLAGIVLLLIFCIPTNMMVSTFTNIWLNKIRHALPVGIAMIAVYSAALGQITWSIQDWLKSSPAHTRSWGRWLPSVVAAIALLAFVPQSLAEDIQYIQRYRLPYAPEVLWRYTDVNVPNDGLILMDRGSLLEKTWNREWAGYDGVKSFQWWFEDAETVLSTPPEAFAERGIVYFAMSDWDHTWAYEDVDIDSFVRQLTLVKHIPAGSHMIGDGVWFYRMMPPQVTADADYGGQIRLAGYDLQGADLQPGDSFTFRPYWRIDQTPSTNYSMFIHLYPADEDQIVAQFDGAPTTPARPTLTWDDTSELYIGPDVPLTLPADLTPGEYRLAVGLYDFSNGARLSTADGATYFSISVMVEAAHGE